MPLTPEELDSLAISWSRKLHIVTANLAYAISAIEADPAPKFQLGTALQIGLVESEIADPVVVATMRHEYTSWVVGHGLADGTEAIAGLIFDLAARAKNELGYGGKLRPFERLGLEGKISAASNIRLKPEHLALVKSMNSARNCLIHRGGVVGDTDCNDSGKLALTWFGPVLHTKDGDRWVEVKPSHRGGFNRAEHGEIFIKFRTIDRSYALGDRLVLPPSDLSSLFWCLQNLMIAIHVSANRLLGFASMDDYKESDWLGVGHK